MATAAAAFASAALSDFYALRDETVKVWLLRQLDTTDGEREGKRE